MTNEEIKQKALELHKANHGKLEIIPKVKCETKDDLSIIYTPGVAYPCLEIKEDQSKVYDYTIKGNTVCVLSDGSAVLGLGNIGPHAGIPVMEGKSLLFKKLANIDSYPLCIDTQDVEEIIKTCKYLAPNFGAINLEDISAPRCVEIERRLIKELDIPVFHDDQHGTAIIVGSALINTCRLLNKKMSDFKIVISGTGAAGSSIARHLYALGARKIYASNITGAISKEKYDQYDFIIKELLDQNIYTSCDNINDTLKDLMIDADVFIGVSAPNIVTKDMIKSMHKESIVFSMANPIPEISYQDAKEAGAYIIGTGRSDYPNQINNCLAFPGIFRGALDVKATKITDEMKLAASYALAYILDDNELSRENIVPKFNNPKVVPEVAKAVGNKAIELGLIRK